MGPRLVGDDAEAQQALRRIGELRCGAGITDRADVTCGKAASGVTVAGVAVDRILGTVHERDELGVVAGGGVALVKAMAGHGQRALLVVEAAQFRGGFGDCLRHRSDGHTQRGGVILLGDRSRGDDAAGVGHVLAGLACDLRGLRGVTGAGQLGLVDADLHAEAGAGPGLGDHGVPTVVAAHRVRDARHRGAGRVCELVRNVMIGVVHEPHGLLVGVAVLADRDDAELRGDGLVILSGKLHVVVHCGERVDTTGAHTQRAVRGLAIRGEHVVVGGVHQLGLDHVGQVFGPGLTDQRGDAGGQRGGHGRTAHDLVAVAGAGRSGHDAHAGGGDIGLGGAVIGAVDATGGEGRDGVFALAGVVGVLAHTQLGGQGHRQRAVIDGALQVLVLGGVLDQLEAGDVGVAADAGLGDVRLRAEQDAGRAGLRGVVEAGLGAAVHSGVVPFDVGDVALDGSGVIGGVCLAAFQVVLVLDAHDLAGQGEVVELRVVHGVLTGEGLALERGRAVGHFDGVLQRLAGLARGHGQRALGGAGGTHDVGDVAVVAGRDHGQHVVCGEVIHGHVLRVVGGAEAAAERHGDDADAAGLVAVDFRLGVVLGDAVKRFEHQVGGAAVVAEHLVRVDAGLGSGAGANLPAGDVAGGQLLVACGIGLARGAVGLDAVAQRGAGDVRAVVAALAVDRVGVRGGIVVAGVRVIRGAGVIVTALELRLVEQLADLRVGQRWSSARSGRPRWCLRRRSRRACSRGRCRRLRCSRPCRSCRSVPKS